VRLPLAIAWPESLRLFQRSPTFRQYRLWGTFSDLGSFAYFVAIGWLVYELTASPFMLGVVAFARTTPVLLFAWHGGVLVDRYRPHRVLLVTQTCLAVVGLVLAIITFTGTITAWFVAFLVVFEGVVNAFDIPARQAITRYLVDRDDLMDAVAISVTQFNVCRMIGPVLSGFIIAYAGPGWCFLLNGISYLAVVIVILKLWRVFQASQEGRRATSGFVQSLAYVARRPSIASILIVAGIPSLFVTHYSTLLPAFVESSLHLGPTILGTLSGVAGAGAVAGSVMNTVVGRKRRTGRSLVAATATAGLALAALPLIPLPILSAVFLFVVGSAYMVGYAQCHTLVQQLVLDEMRGRVLALLTLVTAGVGALGSMGAASVAAIVGVDLTFVSGGLICVAASMAVWASSRSLRSGDDLAGDAPDARASLNPATPLLEPDEAS
jgi:MFS family permease